MSPEFDEYDDVPQQDEPRSRGIPRLVIGLAVAGFLGLAIYAYRSGGDVDAEAGLASIEADLSEYKVAPEHPEGEQFPNKDKTIYDAISSYTPDDQEKVEKLLPEPEAPVKPATAPAERDDTTSWVNPGKDGATSLADSIEAAAAPKAEPKPEAVQKEEPAPVAQKAPEPKLAPVEKKPEPQPVKPAPAPKPAASSSGAYKIQLGAYKSEAEASTTWQRINAKHGAVLAGKPHSIVKAELPNGTYYRLRVSGYASAEAAKAACASLSARGQGCFFAGR